MKAFGDQRPIHVIIAVVLGLLSVRYPLLGIFLAEISPRLGVGLVIILSLIILMGLFIPGGNKSTFGYVLLGVGVIIFIVILTQVGNSLGVPWLGGGFTSELISYIVLATFLIGVIVAVVVSKSPNTDNRDKGLSPFWAPVNS